MNEMQDLIILNSLVADRKPNLHLLINNLCMVFENEDFAENI